MACFVCSFLQQDDRAVRDVRVRLLRVHPQRGHVRPLRYRLAGALIIEPLRARAQPDREQRGRVFALGHLLFQYKLDQHTANPSSLPVRLKKLMLLRHQKTTFEHISTALRLANLQKWIWHLVLQPFNFFERHYACSVLCRTA